MLSTCSSRFFTARSKTCYQGLIISLVFALISTFLVVSIDSIRSEFPNDDEIGHLPAGISHWVFHRFDLYRVNPPLVRVVATIGQSNLAKHFNWQLSNGLRPEFNVGAHSLRKHRLSHASLYVVPKCVCLLFALLGHFVIFFFVTRLLGTPSALIALSMCCFCPNLLAHGHSLCPDSGMAALGITTAFAFWCYFQSPNFFNACFAGLILGCALLTKMTWMTGVVSFPLALFICYVTFRAKSYPRTWFLRFCDLGVIWFVALLVLNAGYQFEGTCQPLGEFEFHSRMLGGNRDNSLFGLGNRFSGTNWGWIPVPLPRNYVLGVDYLRHEVEQKMWSFLNGEWRCGSWPHYYLMTTLYKTPEPTLLAAFLGIIVILVGWLRGLLKPELVAMILLLSIPSLVCFVSVSFQGGFNHHHRYVLMIYPPMFVFASFLASPLAEQVFSRAKDRLAPRFVRKRKFWHWTKLLAVLCVLLSAASSLWVHPHYTSYFNTLCGGPQNGWRLLGSSNIDWGQDLLVVKKWIDDNSNCRPLTFELDYYGMNGELFELPRSSPTMLPKESSVDQVRTNQTQWWIISVKTLYNHPGESGLEYLQQLEPVDKIAFSYHVYRIDPLPGRTPDALSEENR